MQAENLIGAWIDGQLETEDRVGLEAHLASCDACRAASETTRIQDGALLRAFQPRREAAARVADRVLDVWRDETAMQPAPKPRSIMSRMASPLAVAAGFLAAVILFQPWNDHQPVPPIATPFATPVATLVVSTGNVEVRPRESSDWHTVPQATQFLCTLDSAVRTANDVQCELKTSDDCLIRLNGGSEVTLSSSRSVELLRGQIWGSSPEDIAFRVLVQDTPQIDRPGLTKPNASEGASTWSLDCSANSTFVTSIQEGGGTQVTSVRGDILVGTPQSKQRLLHGETANIVKGRIVKEPSPSALALVDSWIHPLLILKKDGDSELDERVDQLIAQLGRAKMSTLYEQEIRSLGESCVLPLIRYIQSPISAKEGRRRIMAVQIVADLAPTAAVSDLIELLSDNDPAVRFHAATALRRLTTEDQGRSPERWREPWADCAASHTRWLRWQTEHRDRYWPPTKLGDPGSMNTKKKKS